MTDTHIICDVISRSTKRLDIVLQGYTHRVPSSISDKAQQYYLTRYLSLQNYTNELICSFLKRNPKPVWCNKSNEAP